MEELQHDDHGWFVSKPKSYQRLLDNYSEVQVFAQSYTDKSRSGYLYALEHFLDVNNLNPTEALELNDDQVKSTIIKAVTAKQQEGSYSSARRIYYAMVRFFELNNREVQFNKTQRRVLNQWKPKKVVRQHVPTKEEIYRASDAIPRRDKVQQLRSRAVVLCLYQSGVRASCLCSWKYGLVKNKLNDLPLLIKVVNNRPRGMHDVALDTKLSGYKLPYYFTFLGKEAVVSLRNYIEARMKYDNWNPKDPDYLFVTTGTISRGKKLKPYHLNDIVKKAFEQIGIDPESIWTHLLRKSFRKTLYKAGLDTDVAETLMGHKLGQSRTAYFDSSDYNFLREEYSKANFSRYPIKQLENTVVELKKNGISKDKKIKELEKQLEYFKSPEFVKDIFKNVEAETFKPSKPKKVLTKVIEIGDAEAWKKLNKEGYSLASSDDKYFVLEKILEE